MSRAWINIGDSFLVPLDGAGKSNVSLNHQVIPVERFETYINAGDLGRVRVTVSVEATDPNPSLRERILRSLETQVRRPLDGVLCDYADFDAARTILEMVSEGVLRIDSSGHLSLPA